MFFSIKNLSALAADPVEAPWDLKLAMPPFESKDSYKAWAISPSTSHAFVSAVEGMSPVIRVSKDNPPVRMHGLVVDYDNRSTTTDKLRELAQCAPSEWVPSWGSISVRRGARLYWRFEKPIPISSGEQGRRFLERMAKDMKLSQWLAGFDPAAYMKIDQYYEVGSDFVEIGGAPIKHATLAYWAWESVRDASLWSDFKRYEIPLDEVEREMNERFPGRWHGTFTIGARGVRFWDSSADNPTGAQVRADGMACYTGDRAFMSWLDIFGKPFVSRFAASKTSELLESTYFDGKKFYSKAGGSDAAEGAFVEWDKADFSQYLKVKGFDPTKGKGRTCSELDEVEISIKMQRRVDYAKRLVHFPRGMVRWRGRTYLNMGAPEPIKPAPALHVPLEWSSGDTHFPYIKSFLDVLFTDRDGNDEHNQRSYLFAWLKRFYEGGLASAPTQGQVVILAGKPDKGKSFFCEGLVGGLMGGCEDGVDYLVNDGRWTENVAESPVMYVGDSRAAEDHRTVTSFSNQLKKIVANATLRSSQKFSKETDVPWFGRIMISCNLDAESLNILPNLELSNQDKILLFRASDVQFRFPERRESEARLQRELPFFARFLLDWKPHPAVLSDSHRFGVAKFHHPELYEAATSQGASGILADYVLAFLRADKKLANDARDGWTGTSTQLYSTLAQFDPQFSKEFKTVRMFQTCLGQLRSRGTVAMRRTPGFKGEQARWTLLHPEDKLDGDKK